VEGGLRIPGAASLDLSKDLLAEEIARIRHEGWSGVLSLTQGEITKGVYFVDGQIVFAASTVEEDRLGASLFRSGKITETQFRAAMKASEEQGTRLGQALIDAGVLDPTELSEAVVGQVERIVVSTLRWTRGFARRESMERPLPADLTLHLHAPRALLLGARGFPDTRRLERALGALTRQVRRTPSMPFDLGGLAPTPPERAVLALCAGSVTLADILALPHPRGSLVRAAYAFLLTGILEEARPAEVASPAPSVPTPAPPRPALEAESELEPEPERLVPRPPPGPEEALRRARSLLEAGDRAGALDLLKQTLERNPGARGVKRLRLMTLAREPGFQPAIERELLAAVEEEADDVELRYALASYYRRGGMAGRAILQLRIVLSKDSHHAGAWRDLGELEAGEGRRRP
jgi:hypothetical protein